MQKAGREQRSTVNNVIIISLIIQKRKSERFNTYLFHVDAVKCFGELWLKDSIVELNIIGSKKMTRKYDFFYGNTKKDLSVN